MGKAESRKDVDSAWMHKEVEVSCRFLDASGLGQTFWATSERAVKRVPAMLRLTLHRVSVASGQAGSVSILMPLPIWWPPLLLQPSGHGHAQHREEDPARSR